MKKVLVKTMMMFVAVATFGLASCDKDDPIIPKEPINYSQLILGTWDTEAAVFTNPDSATNEAGQALASMFSGFTFNADSTGFAIVTMPGTAPIPMPCTWNLNENALTVSLAPLLPIEMNLAITEISEERLVLDGVDSLFDAEFTMHFEMYKHHADQFIIGKWATDTAIFSNPDSAINAGGQALASMFAGFEFNEDKTGSAIVSIMGAEPAPINCNWDLANDSLTVVLPNLNITMKLALTSINKKNMVLDGANKVLSEDIYTMHFEMRKEE